MAANDKRLRSPYNTEEPLKILIKMFNECADFATAASNPVLETHIVPITYVLLVETGQFPEYFWHGGLRTINPVRPFRTTSSKHNSASKDDS